VSGELQRREDAIEQLLKALRDRESAKENWERAIAHARAEGVSGPMAVDRAARAGISPELILEILAEFAKPA